MATNTKNYNLKKPDESDFYDIQDFNDNMDIIDVALQHTIISEEKPNKSCIWWKVVREKIIEDAEIKKVNLQAMTQDTAEPYRVKINDEIIQIKEI